MTSQPTTESTLAGDLSSLTYMKHSGIVTEKQNEQADFKTRNLPKQPEGNGGPEGSSQSEICPKESHPPPSAELMLTVAHLPLALAPEVQHEVLWGPCHLVQQRPYLKC